MTIVFLNGASSSGKSSVARELQKLLGPSTLNFSIDSVLYGLPESVLKSMTTGNPNPGLDYFRVEEGFYAAARAMADLRLDLILDNAVVHSRSAELHREYLGKHQILTVGLHCDREELGRREKLRGDRAPGEAESQVARVHEHLTYDLELDSTRRGPAELAVEIHAKLREWREPSAIARSQAQSAVGRASIRSAT